MKVQSSAISPSQAWYALREWEPFALLESTAIHPKTGRLSILGLGPSTLFQFKNASRAALPALDQALAAWKGTRSYLFMIFSYEWKNALESLPQKAKDDMGFPDALFFAARDVLIWDHAAKTITVHCAGKEKDAHPRAQAIEAALAARLPRRPSLKQWRTPRNDISSLSRSTDFDLLQDGWHCPISEKAYVSKVAAIQRYIAAGDIYQANLSLRFQKKVSLDGFALYRQLSQINPSPFAGYIRWADWEIISCSPERLICKEKDIVSTRPIAGTRPRGQTQDADAKYQDQLLLSPKERSEHIMLVDLERNDLGKICQKGSVEVDECMVVEKYSHVQHIVSNVRGVLQPKTLFSQILRSMFPGGTITGVPKIRCMEILDELEGHVRGPYTGSFGYMTPDGDFDLNIAIRTLVKKGPMLYAQSGAGIVADSDARAEYQEILNKAKAMGLAVAVCSDTMRHLAQGAAREI